MLLLPRRRNALEEVEQLAAAVKELEVQASFGNNEEAAEVEERLVVAEYEEDVPS